MKKINLFVLALATLTTAALALAGVTEKNPDQAISQRELVQRFGFIDEDGDGINDLARDADNDGIPNCLDPDWVAPENGSGYKGRHGYKRQLSTPQNQGGANQSLYNYNYLWNHNWGGGNGTGVCNNTGPNGRQGRNRRSGSKN
ncbi:MAG TPA: hypothetical protein VLQ89_05200 [Candidatus Binatia bacterium]|nr:hypothetical protein [Candidatus Binatia bacterium]